MSTSKLNTEFVYTNQNSNFHACYLSKRNKAFQLTVVTLSQMNVINCGPIGKGKA